MTGSLGGKERAGKQCTSQLLGDDPRRLVLAMAVQVSNK